MKPKKYWDKESSISSHTMLKYNFKNKKYIFSWVSLENAKIYPNKQKPLQVHGSIFKYIVHF